MAHILETELYDRVRILYELWLEHRENSPLSEFVMENALSIYPAFLIEDGLVMLDGVTENLEDIMTECFERLLEHLSIDDRGFTSLDQIFITLQKPKEIRRDEEQLSEEAAELAQLARSQNLSSRMLDAIVEDHIACISREQTCELCEENEEVMGREGEIAHLLLSNSSLSAAQQKKVLDTYMNGAWDQDDVAALLLDYARNTGISDYGKEKVLYAEFYRHWTWDDGEVLIDILVDTIRGNSRFTNEEARSIAASLED